MAKKKLGQYILRKVSGEEVERHVDLVAGLRAMEGVSGVELIREDGVILAVKSVQKSTKPWKNSM